MVRTTQKETSMEPPIAQKSPYASPVEAGKASRSPFAMARTKAAQSRP